MTVDVVYAGPIRLVLFDVDGVLTDGSLIFDSTGEALKTFNVRDGLAIALLRVHGIRSGVLSGKTSGALDFRIQQLGFDVAVTGQLAKSEAFEAICIEEALENLSIAYVGDDVGDLRLLHRGLACAQLAHDLDPAACTHAARPASPTKPSAMAATMNLLRHTGVRLASSGLDA